ncbi:MAG: ABC transporter ATP-binding protein [Chloroflexota bacterium]
MPSPTLLTVDHINVFYEKMQILRDVSLDVGRESSEFVVLLGRNGAGKTTTLRTISGLTSPRTGAIYFEGKPLHSTPPHQISRQGISHVLQGLNIFPQLTVRDNLRFNLLMNNAYQERLERVFGYFPNLKDRLPQQAGILSGGERQMLAIARAWLAQPRLILLDEPTAGLMPSLVWQVLETLRDMYEQSDVSVLLVEQEVELALRFSDRAYVMDKGEIVFEASSKTVTVDDILPHFGLIA